MISTVFPSQAAARFAELAHDRGRDDLLRRFDLAFVPGATELPISVETLREFSSVLAEEIGDANMGIHIARRLPSGVYGLFEYVIRTSYTLRQACQRFTRYHRLINPIVHFAFEEVEKRAVLHHFVPNEAGCLGRQSNEFVLVIMVRFLRELIGEEAAPLRIDFAHPRPADIREHDAFFRCRLGWGHKENVLSFEARHLEIPFRPDEALARVLEQQAEAMLAALPASGNAIDPWLELARRRLCKAVLDGDATATSLAMSLGMSSRSLYRRLQSHGLTFQALLDDIRRELAERWLSNSNRSLAEVAFMLGFAEASSFSRAYKRWTGHPPSRR